jgi:hypothetical protein
MDENHPSLDLQDRRFEEKDPAFDEIHSELNDFISGPEVAWPHFEVFTTTASDSARPRISAASGVLRAAAKTDSGGTRGYARIPAFVALLTRRHG